ncbi:MAG: electron transfer flavoprotein subunit alpha/FixB family protein, partial [Duodenibacillus sp.]
MTILVIAEHDNASLKNSTLHTLECARQIGGEVSLLVAGSGCAAVADQASRIAGVARVYLCDAPELAHQLPEVLARTLAS